MTHTVYVGFGEHKVSTSPDTVLTCFGLGSCVAVMLYDRKKQIGGMLHVVLPTSNGTRASNPMRFADTGIPLLVEEMHKKGADKKHLTAKLVGGAKILRFPQISHSELDIGVRNVQMCEEVLRKLGLRIIGQETGGTQGRTVTFRIDSGEAFVRQRGDKEI